MIFLGRTGIFLNKFKIKKSGIALYLPIDPRYIPAQLITERKETTRNNKDNQVRYQGMDTTLKQSIKVEYQIHERDTGSAEVQVALLSERIKELARHLQDHGKDNSSRRGLIMLVNKRRRLLDYLHGTSSERYKSLIERLGLRR